MFDRNMEAFGESLVIRTLKTIIRGIYFWCGRVDYEKGTYSSYTDSATSYSPDNVNTIHLTKNYYIKIH